MGPIRRSELVCGWADFRNTAGPSVSKNTTKPADVLNRVCSAATAVGQCLFDGKGAFVQPQVCTSRKHGRVVRMVRAQGQQDIAPACKPLPVGILK